jgi:toxin-antitoxin system PIN domain toxin
MELPDVNVLIYAHREDAPEHDKYAVWLTLLAAGPAPFALSSVTLGGFLRIVTNHRIYQPATPMDLALAFCNQLIERPTAPFLQPGARHWRIRWT